MTGESKWHRTDLCEYGKNVKLIVIIASNFECNKNFGSSGLNGWTFFPCVVNHKSIKLYLENRFEEFTGSKQNQKKTIELMSTE